MTLTEKIKSGVKLSEWELGRLVWEDWDDSDSIIHVDQVEGDEHRWNREIKTVIDVDGQLYAIDWSRALTEMQEHYYDNQPYKVQQRTKIIEVKEYVPL